jgi:hypothetical protein
MGGEVSEMTKDALTVDDLLYRLEEECREAGSRKAWAESHGFNPTFVGDVLAGRRPLSPKIAEALGYEPAVLYHPRPSVLDH